MNIRCWDELVRYGALDILRREYGSLLLDTAEADYNVSLQVDLAAYPEENGIVVPLLSSQRRSYNLKTLETR